MLHKELSKYPEMVLTNLHPKVSIQVLTWLDMWLNHSLNIYMGKVYHTHSMNNTKALICSSTWCACVGSKINIAVWWALCVFFQKEKTFKLLLSPNQNAQCQLKRNPEKRDQSQGLLHRRLSNKQTNNKQNQKTVDCWIGDTIEEVGGSFTWVGGLRPATPPLPHTEAGSNVSCPHPAGRAVLKDTRRKRCKRASGPKSTRGTSLVAIIWSLFWPVRPCTFCTLNLYFFSIYHAKSLITAF